MPANVNGGRSSRPSLMKSQVEPQIPHNTNQTRRAFMLQNVPVTKKHKQHELDRKSLRYLCFSFGLARQTQPAAGCGLSSVNAAPCGSDRIAKRPTPGISSAGFM